MSETDHTPARCTATSRRTGERCGAWAIPGLTVCKWHGGGTTKSRAAAKRRQTEAEARRDAARFAARVDIHPAEALLDLVHYQAGIVAYWRTRVEDVTDDDLEWGTTRVKTGGDDAGTTQEAVPHVAYRMLTEAQHDLERFSSAALKAGVDERRVRIAEQQGQLVAQVIRGVLEQLHLTPEQQDLVPRVVPEQLRLIAQTGATS